MPDFFSSDAGRYASIAKQFLEGALTLDEAQRDKGRILLRPTLALAGHGLELMLKVVSHLNEKPPITTGRKGHDILSMWKDKVCEPMRGAVFVNARLVATEERANKVYHDVPNDDDILPLIEEYVIELGKLHGGAGGYALRYPSDPKQRFPRTPFLVKSLWRAADDLVKRPREFELLRFLGQV